jgi:hypothetical protein
MLGVSVRKQLRISLHRNLIRLGIDTRKLRPDRKTLEKSVFRELARSKEYQRILFVGCDWYTLHYPSLFRDKEFIPMEISPDLAQYGAPNHIIDSCENISERFEANSLDCVILNGVFGFGLNESAAIQKTFHAIHTTLRTEGLFVFGWNDLPNTVPLAIGQIEALERFRPYYFPTLHKSIYESESINRHRFHFYEKA